VESLPRRQSGWLVVTSLVLISGHVDIAGQVLLTSGIYAVWCWLTTYSKRWSQPLARKAALALIAGWALGFLLATRICCRWLEYAHTGSRVMQRSRAVRIALRSVDSSTSDRSFQICRLFPSRQSPYCGWKSDGEFRRSLCRSYRHAVRGSSGMVQPTAPVQSTHSCARWGCSVWLGV